MSTRTASHEVIEERDDVRLIRCSTGRTFTARRVVSLRDGQATTAKWVGVCPGCHAARIARYRANRRAKEVTSRHP